MNLPEKKIELNLPQIILSLSEFKETYLEGGRGLGKSFIVADRIKNIVEFMPRSKTAIVCRTFEQAFTRTLPSTINGLQQLGFIKGLHFWVGAKPPKTFKVPEPYEPPQVYDYCIVFYNGTIFQLVSLDKTESGRGFNFDAVIGDEAALLDYEKLMNNVLLSTRGNRDKFRHTWLHGSNLFVSTTPVTAKGRWFTKAQERAIENPKEIFYLVAESQHNIKVLGEEYFKKLRRELLPRVYNAEILCIRQNGAATMFYNTYDYKIHTYLSSNDNYLFSIMRDEEKLLNKNCKFDADVNAMQPIDIAMDYGAKINCLVSGQQIGKEYRVQKSMFVKSPKTMMDLAQEFCTYYKYHQRKHINYYYDHTANYKDGARTTTFADEITKVFIANGWTVNAIYCGQAPRHETKKLFFELAFAEKEPNLVPIRINQDNCQHLIMSIEGAGAVDSRDGIKKDKSPEKQDDDLDEEKTHLSDAFDTLIFNKFKDGLSTTGYLVMGVA